MCVLVCKRHFIRFIVSLVEADMKVGKIQTEAVVVCRDSDEIAYGNRTVAIVDSWPREEYRVIDITTPVNDQTRARLPLFLFPPVLMVGRSPTGLRPSSAATHPRAAAASLARGRPCLAKL